MLVKFINIAPFFSLMPAYTAPALELMDVVYNQVLDSMPLNQQISVRDIVSDVAKRAEVSLNVADAHIRALHQGYGSVRAYREAKNSYSRDYQKSWAKKARGITLEAYEADNAEKRKQKPKNQLVSNMLSAWLTIPGNSQKLIKEGLNISYAAVHRYVIGSSTPTRSLQPRFFDILGLPGQTLENLLNSPLIVDAFLDDLLDQISNKSKNSIMYGGMIERHLKV